MSKSSIEVISVENRSGRSKLGNDYDMNVCQVVVRDVGVDGNIHPKVAELILPKDHPVVTPGMYEAHFGISISQDKKIGGRLEQLTPVVVGRPAVVKV